LNEQFPQQRFAMPKLRELPLIDAETELACWAQELAAADRDSDAASALRLAQQILTYRMGILENEKER